MSRAGLTARVTAAQNALDARKEAGLTGAQLAERLGVTQGMVSRWESGANSLTVTRLAEIAEALGVPFARLVVGIP